MTAARPAARPGTGPVRSSVWRQVLAQVGPAWVTVRYVAVVRARARQADPAMFAASAREDVSRLAAALGGVLGVHVQDGRHRCQACSAGPFQVEWPCRTRRVIEDGLRHGWPTPAETTEPDPMDVPGPHEAFALAVLAAHDVLPAVGGHPARCRACMVPPSDCPVWALADGFLGITWTTQPPPG